MERDRAANFISESQLGHEYDVHGLWTWTHDEIFMCITSGLWILKIRAVIFAGDIESLTFDETRNLLVVSHDWANSYGLRFPIHDIYDI